MARRTTWLIDMGDGTWAVTCMACRIALYRGSKAGADRRRRRPLLRTRPPTRPPAPVGLIAAHPGPGVAAQSQTRVDGGAAHRQPLS